MKDSGKRWGNGAETGNKFREQQRARALLGKNSLGAANAGIGFERNLAEELQNANTLLAAEDVPDGVGRESGDGDKK